MAAAAEMCSMDDEMSQSLSSIVSSTSFNIDILTRPNFVNRSTLMKNYSCGICLDILLQPHQTTCGIRVCKKCIDDKFDGKPMIPCPLSHNDMDEDELREELCQQEGLIRELVVPDPGSLRVLLKEKCFCANMTYGCCDKLQWKKLKDHQNVCQYVPEQCSNQGCSKLLAKHDMSHHVAQCDFAKIHCPFCKTSHRLKDLEDHIGECEYADAECNDCKKKFEKRKHLMVHQRTHAPCMATSGKCFFHSYCKFETNNLPELQTHMLEEVNTHLQAVAVKYYEMEQTSANSRDTQTSNVRQVVNNKVKPLEKVTADIAMKVKKVLDKVNASETNADHLVNAMKTVSHSSQQIEVVQTRVGAIERQIKDSGLDRVTVIESHSQNIRRQNELLTEVQKKLVNLELGSNDGVLIWKINEYKRRKSDAVRGRQMSIYSHPFYTSRCGYKMCCRAYLNGDGLGRGKCLSLFFVMMKGEYDELLIFPFKQKVTFSILCPSNPATSKHETFVPDSDSSSFRRPQTEMNIASGCPQFALHSEVESSPFLVNDCIYIRVKVQPGGDLIP